MNHSLHIAAYYWTIANRLYLYVTPANEWEADELRYTGDCYFGKAQ